MKTENFIDISNSLIFGDFLSLSIKGSDLLYHERSMLAVSTI